jgi:hypothetical protein
MVSPQSRVIVPSYAKRRRSSERMFASSPALAALCRRHSANSRQFPVRQKQFPVIAKKFPVLET